MSKSKYNPTERIGVNRTEEIVVKEFGWIFREQPIVDMGIDAHIEIVNDGKPEFPLNRYSIIQPGRFLNQS